MKFGKTYTKYMEKEAGNQLEGCSYVEFRRLKKVLKKCTMHDSCDKMHMSPSSSSSSSTCCELRDSCCTTSKALQAVPCSPTKRIACCGSLGWRMPFLVCCRAEQLVKLHMATGLRKYIVRGKRNHREAMIQEGQLLINYASMIAIAVRKLLKTYDKVHGSTEGGLFKSRLMAMRGELLKSPYLVEMGALHLNLADAKENTSSVTDLVGEISCDFESFSPTLTCKLIESATLDFDLTCPICLETLYDPVALGCGHLFCNNCACTAASVLEHEGPKTARCDAECAICRQAGVYPDAVKLKELSVLIKNRCPVYWKERSQREREQQLKLRKEFYDQQMEILLGMRDSMFRSTERHQQ